MADGGLAVVCMVVYTLFAGKGTGIVVHFVSVRVRVLSDFLN